MIVEILKPALESQGFNVWVEPGDNEITVTNLISDEPRPTFNIWVGDRP